MDLQALTDIQLRARLLFHWRCHLARCQPSQAPRSLLMFDELLIEAACRDNPHRLLLPVMRHVIANGTKVHDAIVVERIIRSGVSIRTADQGDGQSLLHFLLHNRLACPGFPGRREQGLVRLFVARGCSLLECMPGRPALLDRAKAVGNVEAAAFIYRLIEEASWTDPAEFAWDLAMDAEIA